jgi:iron complex outermembrane receptor protein/vitamin B12 transporter
VTNGQALISQYGIRPIGAEYSRTYDLGVEQSLLDSRLRANLSWFHNEFTNGIQYVSQSALIQQLGIPTAVATAAGYGAYVNSQALRAQGAELEVEYSITRRIFLRTGYTYLDAVVQRSFSSDALSPSFNTSFNFGTIPIGVYAPLTGARPFRRAPHSGYFALSYAGSKLSATVSGTLVGRRDDSTFLTDKDYGNSLLLPNRNLDGAYQRLELTADYRLTHRITSYVNIQNLLNESYSEAFGYPALPINLRGGFKFTFGGETWQLK